jgi:chromosome segregation ATPase
MRSPLLVGLLHPLNLAMLGASVAAALLSAWWLLPVGLVLWAIMVLTVANNPEVKFRWRTRNRAPLARRFQRYFDRIARAQLNVFNSLNATSDRMRRTLQPVQAEVDALTERAHSLSVRMTTLENYRLVSQSKLDARTDQRQIDSALHHANDPLVEREYAESQQALHNHVSELDAVARQLDRVEAQLLSLANEMDTVVTEVIRLQTLQVGDAARYVPRLVDRLRAQRQALETFEREAMAL